jgi:hypothetical protein
MKALKIFHDKFPGEPERSWISKWQTMSALGLGGWVRLELSWEGIWLAGLGVGNSEHGVRPPATLNPEAL